MVLHEKVSSEMEKCFRKNFAFFAQMFFYASFHKIHFQEILLFCESFRSPETLLDELDELD